MSSTDLQQKIERLRMRQQEAPGSKTFAPLADLLRQAGRLEEALVLLEDGLADHPRYLSGMVVLGKTLFDAGRQDRARQVLAKVLDLDPENYVALGLLAEDACESRDWAGARSRLEKLRRLEPDSPRWEKLWRMVNVQTVPDAGGGSGTDPADKESGGYATLSMVDIYVAQGYLSKALAALRLIHGRDPGNPEVRRRMANVLEKMDESSEAGVGDAQVGSPPPWRKSGGAAPEEAESDERARPRHVEMARQRARSKQHFNEWVHRLQDPKGDGS